MSNLLNRLPPEIVSDLGTHLDRDSICQLRLVSREWRAIFGHAFRCLLRTQDIDLSLYGIERLSKFAASQDEDMRGAIRVLNFACLYYPCRTRPTCPQCHEAGCAGCIQEARPRAPSFGINVRQLHIEQFQRSRQGFEWAAPKRAEQAALSGTNMCEALATVLHRLPNINTITLEGVTVYYSGQPDNPEDRRSPETEKRAFWPQLWMHAIRTFRVVLSAICRSQARIKTLSVFRQTPKCAIPTSEFAASFLDHLRDEGFDNVARGMQHLSISIGTPVMPLRSPSSTVGFYDLFDLEGGDPLAGDDPRIEAHANLHGLARFLNFMPNLESLDMHLHDSSLIRGTDHNRRPYPSLLPTIFRDNHFPRLRGLRLSTLSAAERTLVEFLAEHPQMQTLALRHVFLSDGSWTNVLAAAARTCPGLSRVELYNLWQPYGQGVLHLESRCPMARKFNSEDADVRHCWSGPSATGMPFVWFERVFTSGDIWELADVPSDATSRPGGTTLQTSQNHAWAKKAYTEIYHFTYNNY